MKLDKDRAALKFVVIDFSAKLKASTLLNADLSRFDCFNLYDSLLLLLAFRCSVTFLLILNHRKCDNGSAKILYRNVLT